MTQSTVNSKLCGYGYGKKIYWNLSQKAYFEVETNNRHFCTNRQTTQTQTTGSYNNKTQQYYQKPRPKTSNSIQIFKGKTEQLIQRQYETLSDIVTELNGKIHGSQSHYIQNTNGNNNELMLIVYYEVPTNENREQVKQKFQHI